MSLKYGEFLDAFSAARVEATRLGKRKYHTRTANIVAGQALVVEHGGIVVDHGMVIRVGEMTRGDGFGLELRSATVLDVLEASCSR